MARLIYTAITSLDGFVNDADGRFDWAEPSEEVHAFVNDLERPIGTYLYGRRMYEVMGAWEVMDLAGQSAVMRDYAEIWRAADKIVYSKTLQATSTARTRIERDFDLGAIRRIKAESARDISAGGGRRLPRGPSRPGSSTTTTFSSRQSSWEEGPQGSLTMSRSSSSCWTSAALPTGWSTSTTAPDRGRRPFDPRA